MEVLKNFLKTCFGFCKSGNLVKLAGALICKYKFPLIFAVIFVSFLIVFWGKFGNPIVDCGREVYIPYAMAFKGKVLFKDIVCIYGPLPYYLNAFLVRLFGSTLDVMSFIGVFLTCAFFFFFYLISKRFFGALSAFFLSLLILFSCVFSTHIFNYILPYSYAVLYALVFSLASVFFALKFIDARSPLSLYLTAFFISFAIISKYDFLPCFLILPAVIYFYRKSISKKTFVCCVFCFFIPFLALALILLTQGVNLSDLIFNFKMISNMANAPSLEIFYRLHTGFYFVPEKLPYMIKSSILSFVGLSTVFTIGFFLAKIKNKFLKYVIFLALSMFLSKPSFFTFAYFPIFIFLFFVFEVVSLCLKKRLFALSDDENAKLLFIFFTVLMSLKTLFDLQLDVYGTFYFPCIAISFYLIFLKFFKNRIVQYFCGINLVNFLLAVMFMVQAMSVFLTHKSSVVKTPAGNISTFSTFAVPLNSTIKYLQENLKDGDDLVVLPEGLFLNFALRNDYKFFNTSFIPLDFDAYGEEYLTKKILENLPRYLILTNRSTLEYGADYICKDYGQKFCTATNKFYNLRAIFKDEKSPRTFIFYIFERMD